MKKMIIITVGKQTGNITRSPDYSDYSNKSTVRQIMADKISGN